MAHLDRYVLLAVTVGAIAARSAIADPEAVARASQLFKEGRELVKAGKIEEGCAKLETSFSLDPQTGTEVNVADCAERLGRRVEAHRLFVDVAERAQKDGQSARSSFAHDRAVALEAVLGVVLVRLAKLEDGAKLSVAGVTVTSPLTSEVREYVEPGQVHVELQAPHHQPFAATVDVKASWTVVVEVPPLADEVAPTPLESPGHVVESRPTPQKLQVGATPPAPPRTPAPADVGASETRRHRRLVIAAIPAAAGGALAVAAVTTALVARSRWIDARDRGDIARANAQLAVGDVATGLGVAAAACITASIAIYVTAPNRRTTIAPTASTGSIGLAVGGSF